MCVCLQIGPEERSGRERREGGGARRVPRGTQRDIRKRERQRSRKGGKQLNSELKAGRRWRERGLLNDTRPRAYGERVYACASHDVSSLPAHMSPTFPCAGAVGRYPAQPYPRLPLPFHPVLAFSVPSSAVLHFLFPTLPLCLAGQGVVAHVVQGVLRL